MKRCLIIINKNAGTSKKINFEKVEKCLGNGYVYTRKTLPDDEISEIKDFEAVAVCGGDGTLGSVLEKVCKQPIDLFYFPVGTLNDKAKAQRYEKHKSVCPSCSDYESSAKPVVYGVCEKVLSDGKYKTVDCDGDVFAYVFAAGSFTPIGYTSEVKNKQRFGILAYVWQILKEYKPHRIEACIQNGKHVHGGEFTLVMFLKSPRCFGFRFNKAFEQDGTSGHLLAVRSPKHNGLLGKIEMFFPFFRAFFIGLKNEKSKGKIIFEKTYSTYLDLKSDVDFCKDGEKQTVSEGEYKVSFKRSICNFTVIEKF